MISLLNNNSLDKKPLLIFATKNDLEESMSVEYLSEYLSLSEINDREWLIISSSVIDGKGIYEGFFWLIDRFK